MDPNQTKPDQNQALGNQASGVDQVQPEAAMPQPVQAGPPPSEPTAEAQGAMPEAGQSGAGPIEPPKKGISKFTIILIVFLVVAVALTLFVYMAILNKEPEPQQPVRVPAIPTLTPVPLTDEQQLESIDIGNVDQDLTEIDGDLQSL
jgi:hypothetical protein